MDVTGNEFLLIVFAEILVLKPQAVTQSRGSLERGAMPNIDRLGTALNLKGESLDRDYHSNTVSGEF